MKTKLIVIFVLIVAIPIIVLSLFGVKTMRDEHKIVKHRFLALIQQKLGNLDKRIVKLLSRYEKRIYKITEINDYSEGNLRKITRQTPEINYLLVLDKKGNRIFPLTIGNNQDEREFVQRSTQFAQRYYARNSDRKSVV